MVELKSRSQMRRIAATSPDLLIEEIEWLRELNEVQRQVLRGSVVFIGQYMVQRSSETGKLWVRKVHGEAMECNAETEAKLADAVAEFWAEEF